MKQTMRIKILIIILAGTVLIGISYWYFNRPQYLWEKAKNASREKEKDYYTRLAKKKDRIWSGKAYFQLYLKSEGDTALLIAAADQANADACHLLGISYKSGYVKDIDTNIDKAVHYFKLAEGSYDCDCELIEIYLFEPAYRNYDEAARLIRRHYNPKDGYSQRNQLARNYAGILIYMGKGGFQQDMNKAFPLLKDAGNGVTAYYLGNIWMRKSLYDSYRMEYCMTSAMNCYLSASGPYVNWEESRERTELLVKFAEEYEKANDRSHLYGRDEYYYTGAVDKTWKTYTNYDTRFQYDGRMRGSYPHGMGVGQWKKSKELFCGEWKNGLPEKGIYAFGNGDIYVGKFENGKFVKGIYTRSDGTKINY